MHRIKTALKRTYYAVRTWWPIWFYIVNLSSRLKFNSRAPQLTPVQERIVRDLNQNGIAVTSLEELFPGKDMWAEFANFLDTHSPIDEEAQFGKKKFLAHYWGIRPEIDVSNPFFQLAIHPTVLAIANSYMRMWTRLKYYDLATSLVVPPNTPPQQSQNWHRDPEDPRMIKMFLYCSDVDEESGPFIYILGSTLGNRFGSFFPQQPPEGVYPDARAVESIIPKEAMHIMTGKQGTVLFCDTTGLHRGGYATKRDRMMFTSFYSAPSFSDETMYTHPAYIREYVEKVSPEVAFALSRPDYDLTK